MEELIKKQITCILKSISGTLFSLLGAKVSKDINLLYGLRINSREDLGVFSKTDTWMPSSNVASIIISGQGMGRTYEMPNTEIDRSILEINEKVNQQVNELVKEKLHSYNTYFDDIRVLHENRSQLEEDK